MELSIWKTDPLDFGIKEDLKPICSRLYPLPKVNEEMFKNEVGHLVILGVF